jgi:hypothetical protein
MNGGITILILLILISFSVRSYKVHHVSISYPLKIQLSTPWLDISADKKLSVSVLVLDAAAGNDKVGPGGGCM